MPKIGTIERLGIRRGTEGPHPTESLRRLDCIISCVVCGEEVELWAHTDHWTLNDKAYFEHIGYGQPEAECCKVKYTDTAGIVRADSWKEHVETKIYRVIIKRDTVPASKVRR